MDNFKTALYEAVIFSYGKVLAKYNAFDQEVILKDIGKDLLEYLGTKGFPFKEGGSLQDIENIISYFVENGFSTIEVKQTAEGDEIIWGDLFGRDAYERLQEYSGNPFLSCPLNASAVYIANKYNKSLLLKKKDFSDPHSVTSMETLVDKEDGISAINPLIIENAKLIDLLEEKNKELKELKHKYIQAQKMEAVGTLVGGVAHNFNNILAGVIGKAYLVNRSAQSVENKNHLHDIQSLGDKASKMVSQLLVFSRAHVAGNENVSISLLYKEAIKLARLGLPENITLTTDICDENLHVNGDINELQQLLINLVNNARDGLIDTKEKHIWVSLKKDSCTECNHSDSCDICKDNAATLTVKDNGMGIPEEHLDNIYDPFFTTKEVGKGTGLGLSTAYGTVQSHGGNIHVKSTVNQGTKFTVCFPLVAGSNTLSTSTSQIISAKETSTILLVDDDATVLDTLSEILTELGYNVLKASDGEQAIKTYKENIDTINLVISDIIMPKLGGCDVIKEVLSLSPSLPAILITGYSEELARKSLGCDEVVVLMKPVKIPELSQKISNLLSK